MAKLKILFIEDYPVVQEMYGDVLKTEFDLTLAADGKEALEKIKAIEFDILLLDLLLPTVGGKEFLIQFRELHPDIKKPRVIVLSDFDNPQTRDELEKLGVVDYWMKVDNTPHELVDKIKALKLSK